MTSTKEKASELQLGGKDRNTDPFQESGVTMNTSIPDFSANFDISTGHARIEVQSEAHYWRDHDTTYAREIAKQDLVRLTDNSESHILLSPAEALSVAAALQAVAVHLMENAQEVAA